MTDVWQLPAIARWEKTCGKHPTQKPLSLLTRIILASTRPNAWILDPFSGSSTTGIAASLVDRRYLGIEREKDFLDISKSRREELNNLDLRAEYRKKIKDIAFLPSCNSVCEDIVDDYVLPFQGVAAYPHISSGVPLRSAPGCALVGLPARFVELRLVTLTVKKA